MPIIHHKASTTIVGPEIQFYRLCTLRGAVGLECKGIKVRRGPVIWKQVAKEFGIKGNRQAVYEWLCKKVEEERPKQEHIDATE